ncbi:helix-turn-helix domain-containing protein [Anoxybacillus sp. TBDG-1]
MVRKKRSELNLSLREVSECAGIHSSYIWKLEKDKTKVPSFLVVCSLIEVLHLDIVEVFSVFGYKNLIIDYLKEYQSEDRARREYRMYM